jgi:hypothetical protein
MIGEAIGKKTKYVELSQEMKDKLINVHSMSKETRRLSKEYVGSKTEEIRYAGIRQEISMSAIRTEEVRRKAQLGLADLDSLREYVKRVDEFQKRGRATKGDLAEIVASEMAKAEERLGMLEEDMKRLQGKKSGENVLLLMDEAINRISAMADKIKGLDTKIAVKEKKGHGESSVQARPPAMEELSLINPNLTNVWQ